MTKNIKEIYKYISKSLFCSKLNSIYFKVGFINFKCVEMLRGEFNSLETLNGLQDMRLLKYLLVRNNELGNNELEVENGETDALVSLVGKENLVHLDLVNNKIIHIIYISKLKSLKRLFLSGNSKFALEEMPEIADVYLGLSGGNKDIDSVFLDYMQTSDNFKYKNLLETDTMKINYLIELSQNEKDKVKYMDLSRKSNRR